MSDASNTSNSAALPVIDPQLEADIKAWEEAMMAYQKDKDELKKMLLMLTSMANPLIGAQMIMLQMMKIQGDQVQGFAAISNVDSDMRAEITGQQSGIFGGNGQPTPADMQKFLDSIEGLEAFLQEQANSSNPIIDKSVISNMQTAIDSIKSQFGTNGQDWGDPTSMASDVSFWTNNSQNGQSSPQLSAIQNAFQTLNQSVSSLSTTTNTKLQYQAQMYQQYEGITNDTMQTYESLVSNLTKNQKSA